MGDGSFVHTLPNGSMITFIGSPVDDGRRAAALVDCLWHELCLRVESHDQRIVEIAGLPRAERPAAYSHLRRACMRIRALEKRVFDAARRLDEPTPFLFHTRPRSTGLAAAWLTQRLADHRRYEQSRYGIIIHDEVAFTSPSSRAGASADEDTDAGTTAWS